MSDKNQASASDLNDEQKETMQDPQVEVTHPDSFARKQAEATTADPDTLVGSGNNPTAEQGGVGAKTDDLELDPSQSDDRELRDNRDDEE